MPIQETLTKFNWVDIVILVFMLTSCYKGSQKGFIVELFKLVGIVSSVYVSLHYFSQVSDYFVGNFPVIGVIFSDFICFAALALFSYLVIVALRGVFCRLFKIEAVSTLERWGGLGLGFLRGLLAVSMLLILFYLSTAAYLKTSVRKSHLGSRLVFVDIKVYESLFNGVVSRFSPQEKLNNGIYEVIEEE